MITRIERREFMISMYPHVKDFNLRAEILGMLIQQELDWQEENKWNDLLDNIWKGGRTIKQLKADGYFKRRVKKPIFIKSRSKVTKVKENIPLWVKNHIS